MVLFQNQFMLAQQNVGIGTTTPNASALLDVSSTTKGILIPRMTGAQRLAIPSPSIGLMVIQTNTEAVPPSMPGLYLCEQVGAFTSWRRIARTDEVTGGASTWTVNGVNQYSNVSGNVGIGTGSPASKLHMVGDFLQDNGTFTMNNASSIIQLQNAGVNKGFMQLTGNHLRIGTNSGNTAGRFIVSTNNTESIVVDSIGRVGVGLNTGINEKFTLKGNALITFANGGDLVNGGANASLRLIGAGTGSSNIRFLDPDSTIGGQISYSPIFDVLTVANGFNTDANARFYDNGNVGIGTSGTSNAVSKLQIEGGDFIDLNTHNGYLMMGTTSSLNMALGRYGIQARDNGAEGGLYLQQSGGPVRIGNGSAEQTRLQIMNGFTASLTSNGYLLLGGHTQQSLALSSNNIQSRNNGVASDLYVQNYGGDFNVQLGTLVVSNANVGIGTSNPLEKMHIIGNALLNTTNPIIQLQNSGVDKGFIQLSGDNIRIGTNSGNTGGKFVIRTNGSDNFFVDANGNVNIGSQTDAPGFIFRVGGRMICEEVKVKLQSSGWPDYVFSASHNLPSLKDLDKFIQANKHLPNIPSAAEVEKNGLELGDMQKRMMEKIEELTLYIIQQQKELDVLKHKVNGK